MGWTVLYDGFASVTLRKKTFVEPLYKEKQTGNSRTFDSTDSKKMYRLLVLQIFLICMKSIFSLNSTQGENRIPSINTQYSGRPTVARVKAFPGLDSVLGVMGPLALAAMVSLPFVAPAAAALLPLASLSSVFGRRRRHLDGHSDALRTETEALMRRIHAAAIRRNIN